MAAFILVIDNGETEEVTEHATMAAADETFQARVKGRTIFDAQIVEQDDEGNVVRTHIPERKTPY